ncbi:MAG: methionine--tRNA ligase [Candidatus Zixiibacteriota bacterium]|nr:MAG: methionine--tRNA ligase [candidate division Zixibacteria bacterium]
MRKPFYITTPIYYVNDRPHIGHAYTTIAADLVARFHRLADREAFFLTGTDEHGSKVAEAAAEAGMSEIDFCNRTVETFKTAWKNLDIDYSFFIRTTSERHLQAVRKILDAMRTARTEDGREVVYSDYYEGLYCTGCEKFITEKELLDGLCPDHQRAPDRVREKNYFFRLTAYLPRIIEMIEGGELQILPEERRKEVLGLIGQNLQDFSLSRERVKWGIPLTFDPTQVAYVWVDALSNYISAVGYADNEEEFAKWWQGAEVVHLMAKDILKFHCLYWPAMLMAAGLKVPDRIFLHGYFTVDRAKMSKSLGNFIDPNDLVAQFGADGTRYLLLTQYPFGADGDIQAGRFVEQYNSDLANDLGNLVSRVVKMIATNFDGKLPGPHRDTGEIDRLMEITERATGTAYEHVKHFRLSQAIAVGMDLVRSANKFFNDTAPWVLAREGRLEQLGGILYACCEVLRVVSVILYPVMPRKMQEIRKVLSLDDTTLNLDSAMTFFELNAGVSIHLDGPIFPRLEAETVETGRTKPVETSSDNLIDISEFAKLDIRVAEVLEAAKVEGADKLLQMQIDTGTEKRQIVAGIAQHYAPEQMVGMRILVVTNLKPATIRGVESNGMLLAATKGKNLRLVTLDGDLPPGARVS